MSVLIKNMEMPKNCVECKLSDHISPTECPIYSIEKGDYWDKRYKYCPLVEVPPHGRLIDADELKEDITEEAINLRMNGLKGTPRSTENHRWATARLDEAPTIIEAEGSDHGK